MISDNQLDALCEALSELPPDQGRAVLDVLAAIVRGGERS